MKTADLFGTALTNTLRSKMRTVLTVIAIVIGAFALTLTSGLGSGVNKYVSTIVEGYGDDSQMYVMAAADPTAQMPTGMISRAVAGVVDPHGALVVNLPGSPGGVRDGMPVIVSIAAHVIEQVAGGDH